MYDEEISQAAWLYDVPESWIRAVIETESSWNPNAYRWEPKIQEASYGLMQLLGSTAVSLGFTGDVYHDLYQPGLNITLGAKLLGQLRQAWGDDFRRVYSAYNSGRPDLWQTSQEVAEHVANAVENLAKWTTETPAGTGVAVLVGLALLLVVWRGK